MLLIREGTTERQFDLSRGLFLSSRDSGANFSSSFLLIKYQRPVVCPVTDSLLQGWSPNCCQPWNNLVFCNLLGQIESGLVYYLCSFTLSSKYAAGLDPLLVNCGHRLCGLNQENLFLEILETGKFKISVLTGSVPSSLKMRKDKGAKLAGKRKVSTFF